MENYYSILNAGQLCFFQSNTINKEAFHLNKKRFVEKKILKVYNKTFHNLSARKFMKKEQSVKVGKFFISKILKLGFSFCFFFFKTLSSF